ncbi:hypothetical protein [Streptomyces omiyaensis]|uniref:hypothetical protein n=1 Tax=Streptomyces omiyaensis TaxID=68247 RepID=UPI0036FF53D5
MTAPTSTGTRPAGASPQDANPVAIALVLACGIGFLAAAVAGGVRPLAPADGTSRDLLRSYGCR